MIKRLDSKENLFGIDDWNFWLYDLSMNIEREEIMQHQKTIANPKTSVRIWRPIMEKLDIKLETACLRRDAYLARVIDREISHMENEVRLPNSKASYDHVLKCLDLLDRKIVTLTLPPDVVARVNLICTQKMIVRDAFFNRVFLLLAAAPKTIDRLLFGSNDWRNDLWKGFPDAYNQEFLDTMSNPLAPTTDPFWAIRQMFEEYSLKDGGVELDPMGQPEESDNIYTSFFSKVGGADLTGLSCYLPDWRVPGTVDNKKKVELDEILAQVGDLL
jgi:hypothetical protein